MIPSSRKFPLRTQFLAFRRSAKRRTTPLCTIYFLPGTGQSRLSVIVPKKVNKLATARNWLRRLTYTYLWPQTKDKNLDLVVVYKPLKLAISPDTKQQLAHELTKLAQTL